MRKKSALKNIVSKMIYSIVITLLSFVSRRVFVSTLGDTTAGVKRIAYKCDINVEPDGTWSG